LLTNFGYRSFAFADTAPGAPNLGLEVQELGIIGLPLSTRDADALKAKCHMSSFGKGEETLVDAAVRSSWELDSSEFQLSNPAWQSFVEKTIIEVYGNLGLLYGRENLKVELYKLLIYEEGAFVKSHQDSEKTNGMLGTLVVSLPSKHEGSKVILRHSDSEAFFDSAKDSPFETSFAAWYPDVFHEVEK